MLTLEQLDEFVATHHTRERGYALNAEAGEQIRVIDLAAAPNPMPHQPDFWLIDGREAVAMHYASDGRFDGARVLDPQQLSSTSLPPTLPGDWAKTSPPGGSDIHNTTARRTPGEYQPNPGSRTRADPAPPPG